MEFTNLDWTSIRDAVRYATGLVFFPAMVIGVLIYITVVVTRRVRGAADRVRRLTAALLPVVGLFFAFVSTNYSSTEVTAAVTFGGKGAQLFIGILLGAVAVFAGRTLTGTRFEIGPTLYVLFLSLAGSFTLFVATTGALSSLHFYLFGTILGGAAYVIARGWIWPEKKATAADAEPAEQADRVASVSAGQVQTTEPPKVHPPSI
jgi:hypothetical protein